MVDIPKHVGIIMDGNGRWGKSWGLTRSEGHYAGVQAMEKAIDASIALGVEALTLYAFSSENWAGEGRSQLSDAAADSFF